MNEEKYYVLKTSGTYSNALEAYGLAELLQRINNEETEILVEDKGTCYELTVKNHERLDIKYFNLFPYLKKEKDIDVEGRIPRYIDIKEEKERNKRFAEFRNSIRQQKEEAKKKGGENVKHILKELDKKIEESELKPREDWDIIHGTEANVLKAIDTYNKIYLNLFNNQESFDKIVDCILKLYETPEDNSDKINKEIAKYKKNKVLSNISNVDSLQMYNPSMVKGAHSPKANKIKSEAKDGLWLREYMKIAGSYNSMIMKSIKINSKIYDYKIYVLDFNRFFWDRDKRQYIFNKFKLSLRGNTSIKLDINSILLLTKRLIEYHNTYVTENTTHRRRYKPKDEVNGFYTTYFKNMGNASSPSNISYLELPTFIELETHNDGADWIKIIEEHLNIINNIKISASKNDETGSIIPMLQDYRMFLTTGDINYFFDFATGYSVFLMQQVIEGNNYVRPFTIKNMEVLLMKYDQEKFGDILNNEGFKNIAKAIRLSTISEQYAKARGNQNYEIRYGLAQDLIRKSAYKGEFIKFLSEFTVSYNQETARHAEKKKDVRRQTIKQQDIEDIIKLIDEYDDSSLIGRMLCAFGYSLDRKSEDKENVADTLEQED